MVSYPLWVALVLVVNYGWSCLPSIDLVKAYLCVEGWGLGTEGHDMQWKRCTKTGFPVRNGEAPSLRKRTQSISLTHQVDCKAPSPCDFTGLSDLLAPIIDVSTGNVSGMS